VNLIVMLICSYFDSWDNSVIIWWSAEAFYGSEQGSCEGRYSCHNCWYAYLL